MLYRIPEIRIPKSEFPKVEKQELQKFRSFDPDLGWERQPDESRFKNNAKMTTDEYGSRKCPINREASELKIATFGDSYCFDTEVSDDKTFQYFLAESMNVHVSNYGVGNYGLDQALLRVKKRLKDDPADYVIMAYSDVSYPRIINVYQHYLRFGNNWALKPRFKINEAGELRRIPCVVESREDLLTLEENAEYLRKYDYHYKNWYKPHQPFRPWTARLIRDKKNVGIVLTATLDFMYRRLSYSGGVHKRLRTRKKYWMQKQRQKGEYHAEIVRNPEYIELFSRLMREFTQEVRDHGAVPVFLPLRHAQTLVRSQSSSIQEFDKRLLNTVKRECTDLHILDTREKLVSQVDDTKRLYTREKYGYPWGHHSPEANRMIAKYIEEFIRSHEG